MTNDGSNRLFEVGDGAGAEPFEEDGLRQRTDFQSRAPRAGADFKQMAIRRLTEAGGTIERLDFEIDDIPVDALVSGPNGRRFLVIARGTPDEHGQSGIRKTDTLEKAGFRAVMLARSQDLPILLITSDLPKRASKAGRYLAKLDGDVWDVVSYRADLKGFHRLQRAFAGPVDAPPPAAEWRGPLQPGISDLFDSAAQIPDDRSADVESLFDEIDLAAELFSSREPFRLWGIHRADKHYGECNGVDLHVGECLRVEVQSELLRIHLYEGGCGNTVARLITNLQHHVDGALRLVDPQLQELMTLQTLVGAS